MKATCPTFYSPSMLRSIGLLPLNQLRFPPLRNELRQQYVPPLASFHFRAEYNAMHRRCLYIQVDQWRGLGYDEDQLDQARARSGSLLVEGRQGPVANTNNEK